jgi:hypothetical protein
MSPHPENVSIYFTCRACSSLIKIEKLSSGEVHEEGHRSSCLPKEVMIVKQNGFKPRF